jgi:DNA polymerase I-like protein with 3'-5' exonuclease and polymerase domains
LILEGREDLASKVKIILEAKNIATQLSKYVSTAFDALAHTGDGYIYGAPRIFGTYTGRFTYSNASRGRSTTGAAKDFKTGIALHQIPRKAKAIRELLLPPEGYGIYEADAAGQESRLMAIRSGDDKMLSVFRDGLNFHSATGASIIGMDYAEFEAARAEEERLGVAQVLAENRQMGKLANLSCNYRISGAALSKRALISYDTPMSIETGTHLVRTFNRMYPGVVEYWEATVRDSRSSGYVSAFGGRRFGLTEWGGEKWATESSAINFPIQSAGASMKEIAICETFKHHGGEATFALDLHDANFFYVELEKLREVSSKLDMTLNNINYEKYWGFRPSIPLPYESKSGVNFSQVK